MLKSHDRVESTGIGFAIVKRTVEAEEDESFVESEVGRGRGFERPDR